MLANSLAALLLIGSTATAEGGGGRSAALQKEIISKSIFVGRRLEDDNAAQAQSEHVFDPSMYALSYQRCAAVQQFDNAVAASEDTKTALATKNFAVFRFCPASTCDAEEVVEEGGGRRLQNANGEQQQEQTIYGARGSGCKSDYGEYMVELEEYLQIMAEYQDGLAEDFCSYCEDYMYSVYQAYVQKCMNNGGCRRDLKYEDFKNDASGEVQRELGFNFGVCSNYGTTCKGALDSDFKDYFACKQANGAYVGPHCAEDGYTVTLGAFSDANCNVFLGGNVVEYLDVDEEYLDEDGMLDKDALKSWYNSRHGTLSFLFDGEDDAVCIPCKKSEYDNLYEELTAYAADDDSTNADDQAADSENEMGELCATLYTSSAHCHTKYADFTRGTLSEREWKEMQLSCSFIDSVVIGNYDEMGYINLQNNWISTSESTPQWLRTTAPLVNSVARVSLLQYFFLICSILAFIGLAAWSKSLHSSLVKKESWAPRRQWSHQLNIFRRGDHPAIHNIDSGIGVSRIRSEGTSYYMS